MLTTKSLSGSDEDSIGQRALNSIRTHLGMEIGYLSEFVEDKLVLRLIDAPGLEDTLTPGYEHPLNDTLCYQAASGSLPPMMPDTSLHEGALALDVTHQLPVGAHISVPIRRPDGTLYGTFCCLSPNPQPSLTERDLSVMRMFADLCQEWVNSELQESSVKQAANHLLDEIIEHDRLSIHLQPIVDLTSRKVCGYEALSRFRTDPYRPPDMWFKQAASVGRLQQFETLAIEYSLANLERLPNDAYLSVNASPGTVLSGMLPRLFDGVDGHRLVLEITEHEAVQDFETLGRCMDDLRARGIRIAVDDAGAGYAGLSHIAQIAPDLLKLDRSLVSVIDQHEPRAAIVRAMAGYAVEAGAKLVAEGIETEAELERLLSLGVGLGQGYYLCRPLPAEEALAYRP